MLPEARGSTHPTVGVVARFVPTGSGRLGSSTEKQHAGTSYDNCASIYACYDVGCLVFVSETLALGARYVTEEKQTFREMGSGKYYQMTNPVT